MTKLPMICELGGVACGTDLPQLYNANGLRVCPKHNGHWKKWAIFEPACSESENDGGRCIGSTLWKPDRKCRFHHFYASAKPCIEDGCHIKPEVGNNGFVGGRCRNHAYQLKVAPLRAALKCSQFDRGDCGPQASGPGVRLFGEGKHCRRHHERLRDTGSFQAPVCLVDCCDVDYDTDPGDFQAGRCERHYEQHKRDLMRAVKYSDRCCQQCFEPIPIVVDVKAIYCSPACNNRAWRERNPETARLHKRVGSGKRNAQKYGNPGYQKFTAQDLLAAIETVDYCCTYCGEKFSMGELDMDHIVALWHGGPHRLSNLTPACRTCNISKKNRPLLRGWTPKLLGGHPTFVRYPRIERNPWKSEDWRDEDGPLPQVLAKASNHPELLRCLLVSESFFNVHANASGIPKFFPAA